MSAIKNIQKIIGSKRGAVGFWYENWVEIFAFVFLVIGALLAATATSRVVTDVIIFLCGAIGGRLWYQKRNNLKTTTCIILIGFLVGFLLGNRYGGVVDATVCYLFGIVLSYYLHSKKMLQD